RDQEVRHGQAPGEPSGLPASAFHHLTVPPHDSVLIGFLSPVYHVNIACSSDRQRTSPGSFSSQPTHCVLSTLRTDAGNTLRSAWLKISARVIRSGRLALRWRKREQALPAPILLTNS